MKRPNCDFPNPAPMEFCVECGAEGCVEKAEEEPAKLCGDFF